jgi:hypothetical protein
MMFGPSLYSTISSGFEVFDDLLGEDIGVGKIVGFFQAFVPEPEDVEAGFVAVDKFFVIVGLISLLQLTDR